LKEYVAEHGNAFVPQIYPQNESLGIWVGNQRQIFKALQLGYDLSEAILTKKRVQKLDEIGFVWDVLEAIWFKRLQELKACKIKDRNTLEPIHYHAIETSLGRWVVHNDRNMFITRKRRGQSKKKWNDTKVLDEEVNEEIKRLTRRRIGMTERGI
jgi:hypothetical protein